MLMAIPAMGALGATAPGMLGAVVHDAASISLNAYFTSGLARGLYNAGSQAVKDWKAQDWEGARRDLGFGTVDGLALFFAARAGVNNIQRIANSYNVQFGAGPGQAGRTGTADGEPRGGSAAGRRSPASTARSRAGNFAARRNCLVRSVRKPRGGPPGRSWQRSTNR